MSNNRRTGILCTIGPASQDEAVLEALLEAGMDMVRFNFSHGTHESHGETFAVLRRLEERHKKLIPILQDLSGPKIRLGSVAPGTVIKNGDAFVLTSDETEGNSEIAHVSYPRLAQEVAPNSRILLDDGLLELLVERCENNKVFCRVVTGGPVSSHKGVNLPGAKLSVSSLTEKDADDLRFGLKMGVDYVALSFVRSARDVEPVRAIMAELGIQRPIIAKIEKPEAVENISEIIEAFDGVMVARGDLGVEMPIEDIPVAQKHIIAEARRHFKPVITATQMLDSMIRNPRPTRAEVTDIANAIWDGTDVVMLSGETASGAYPVEAVSVMDHCARVAETALPYSNVHSLGAAHGQSEEAVALSACEIAEVSDAKAIVVCTSSGRTARMVSHFRPRSVILALTHDVVIARQVGMYFGVTPHHIERLRTADALVLRAVERARESGYVAAGEKIVVVAGFPPGAPTNFLCVVTL